MKLNQISSFAILFLLIGCNSLATPSEIKLAPIPTFTPTKTRTPFPTVTSLPSQTATLAPDQFDWFMISPDGTKKIRAKDAVVFEILDIASNKVLWSFYYDVPTAPAMMLCYGIMHFIIIYFIRFFRPTR